MTEEEARTKWCPFARVPFKFNASEDASTVAANRDSANANCVGSACMAWRQTFSGAVDNPAHAPGAGYSRRVTGGYCGLAGAPE